MNRSEEQIKIDKEKCKLYYKNNREKVLARKKKWYYENHEEVKCRKRENRIKYRDDYLHYTKDRRNKIKYTVKYRFTQAKSTAKGRDLDWDISFECYDELIQNPCHYCFNSLHKETGVGLDRINNNIGYNLNNVLPCCGSCNKIRGDNLTVEEMEIAMKAILEFRKITI